LDFEKASRLGGFGFFVGVALSHPSLRGEAEAIQERKKTRHCERSEAIRKTSHFFHIFLHFCHNFILSLHRN
jgi:hypothetical protein